MIYSVISALYFYIFRVSICIGTGSRIKFWRVRTTSDSRINIGSFSQIESRIAMERSDSSLTIGCRSFIGGGWISCARSVVIGDDVLISWNVAIFDHGSHSLKFSERRNDVTEWRQKSKSWSNVKISPVFIESKSWIGYGATILPGVTIGEGSVVGACSIVTHDVAPWTVVAGNPARVIRHISTDER